MGGRGASSGGGGGSLKMIKVKMGGGTVEYTEHKGTVYSNKNGIPEPIGSGSLSAIAKKAENNGFEVTKYNAKQLAQYEKKVKADRKATNEFLNQAYANDKTMSKGSRVDRINNRVNRRK